MNGDKSVSLNFDNPHEISQFIKSNFSGIYKQKNSCSDIIDRYVRVQNGQGLVCCTVYANKPKYIECVCYNQSGFQTEVYYEPAV